MSGGASGGSTHAPSRCLYVSLNVPRDANPSDIKKAYRKEALVWHPDKNVGNEAEAQVRFQELQHAYAVLSDAHERKWYDDHRDEILNPSRYGDGDSDEEGGGRTVNLNQFFSASAFSGFGDDESGFYQTYNRAFHGVWEAERDWGQVSGDASGWGQGDAPDLGAARDSYETAEAFYSGWSGFVSGLSFGWVDEYNLNEAESRRVRRLMEKENSKKRAVARRKYQDDVRALVDFCRRRDRRVIKHKLQLAKQKEARDKKRQEEARVQKEDIKHRKEEWARARQREEAAEEAARERDGRAKAFRLGDTDSDEDEEDDRGHGKRKKKGKRRGKKEGQGGGEEQEVTVFRCAVCKKDFKSKGQMSNHETSKAHKKKMEELDAEMLREAVSRAEGESEEDSDIPLGSSDVDSPDDEDLEKEEEEEEERDFFLDSAMRDLDLEEPDASSNSGDGIAGDGQARGLDAGESDASPPEKSGGNKTRGAVATSTEGRRGLFDFGSSSSSSSGSSSSNDSESGSDSGDGSSSEQEGGGDGDGASGNQQENSELWEAIETASAAAKKYDPDGHMRTGAASAAAVAVAAAATSIGNVFHVKGDLGASVAGLSSAGLSWWKKHNAEGAGTGDLARDGLNVGEEKGAGSTRSVGGTREAGTEHGGERPSGDGGSSGGSDGGEGGLHPKGGSSEESDKVERIEPAGKRGRRKGGKAAGKGAGEAGDVVAAEMEKGARRRRRQAVKAAKAGRGKGGSRPEVGGAEDGLSCRVCGKHFASRSKLFAHVKAEGHALLA